ncbi:MAG TPA: dihydroorotase [Thermomicrobiales bacterium]|jgi:dihydroorotase
MSRDLLLRGGRILDAASGRDEIGDLLIVGGLIAAVGGTIAPPAGAEILDLHGLVVTPGWIDLHTHLREPGFEYKETIQGGAAAAAQGGFTTVCCMPNTRPALDTSEQIAYVLERARGAAVRVLPIATITRERALEEPVDFAALATAGAIGFSDDGESTSSAHTMLVALEASKVLRRPIMVHCEEPSLVRGGALNAGPVADALGLPGSPPIAEEVMLARDLTLAAATGGWLFACHTTTARGVALIREAKARGVHVTAEVTPHHLALTDEWVAGSRRLHWEQEAFPAGVSADANTKVNPPLRTGADIEALVEGLRDGTIDTIGTDHAPHAASDKPADYRAAAFGMLGFEVALPTLMSLVRAGALDLPTIIAKLTVAPAAVLGDILPPGAGTLAVGAAADVTIFDTDRRWMVTPESLRSSSKNTPLLGREVQGMVTHTIVGGEVRYRA